MTGTVGMLSMIDAQQELTEVCKRRSEENYQRLLISFLQAEFGGPGGWNDMDMLVLISTDREREREREKEREKRADVCLE